MPDHHGRSRLRATLRTFAVVSGALAAAVLAMPSAPALASEPIRIVSTLDLDGPYRLFGRQLRQGLRAALHGQRVGDTLVQLSIFDDNFDPDETQRILASEIEKGFVATVSSLGTPSIIRTLPMLSAAGIPAIGPVAGTNAIRQGQPLVLNVRAGFVREIVALVDSALDGGVRADQVCAILPAHFAPGIVKGVLAATVEAGRDAPTLAALAGRSFAQPSLSAPPVLVYDASLVPVPQLVRTLQAWRNQRDEPCRLLLLADTTETVVRITEFARHAGSTWIIATPSFVGPAPLARELLHRRIDERIVMTRLMPALDAELPLLDEARAALGDRLSDETLEGYLNGRFALHLLREIAPSRDAATLVARARAQPINLGGVIYDYSDGSQDAFREVRITYLAKSGWPAMTSAMWKRWP